MRHGNNGTDPVARNQLAIDVDVAAAVEDGTRQLHPQPYCLRILAERPKLKLHAEGGLTAVDQRDVGDGCTMQTDRNEIVYCEGMTESQ